ncbi:hypothetical protein [Anaerolinea thermophila]|uniref:WD40 repeat domain-containing protein n=1 Tax=Anaerolinea thermophila (strain DSM 14523 / JCM 11388 / NBRC 100420 / UNI-1) TaxID=926569 RepID=E8MYB5_ANATU|nr:hypothetical protein [Anaerolinea thermophila]BAJ62060.1 hypothetical protein ANT_00260 [Anaerolinea thermophila UNI-1]
MKPLHISPSGKWLFHATPQGNVMVWDLSGGTLHAVCDGLWIGHSLDEEHLLTQTPEGVKAWNLPRGEEEPLALLKAELFALHQRVVVRKQPYTLQLDLLDVLTGEMVLNLRFEQDPRYHPRLEACALAPDDRSLLITLAGEFGGQAWAHGYVLGVPGGARRVKFKVNRHQPPAFFAFTAQPFQVLLQDEMYHLTVLNLEQDRFEQDVWVSGFSGAAAFFPLLPAVLAVSVWEPIVDPAISPFSVQFLDLRRTSGERMRRAAVIAVFQESQPVHDMIFTPDGQTLAVLVSTGAIHLWNLAQGRIERTLEL